MTETTAVELARSFASRFPFVDLGPVRRVRFVTLSDYQAAGVNPDGATDAWLVSFRRVPLPVGSALDGAYEDALFRVSDTSGAVEFIESL